MFSNYTVISVGMQYSHMQQAVAVRMKKTTFLTVPGNIRDCSHNLFSGSWLASSTLADLFIYCVTGWKNSIWHALCTPRKQYQKLKIPHREYTEVCTFLLSNKPTDSLFSSDDWKMAASCTDSVFHPLVWTRLLWFSTDLYGVLYERMGYHLS